MSDHRAVVFQSEHLSVVCSEQGSETVVVTFNELGLKANGTAFWGADLLERVGVSAIGFVSAKPNWYPIADMAPALEAARARIGNRRVITYGHSQGGYGALKFGGALSARMALGFSPQWSIDPSDVAGFDQRYTKYHARELRNGLRVWQPDLCPNNLIFFDPADVRDTRHAEELSALGRVTTVKVPFTGHDTIRLVAEGHLGRRLIGLCLEDRDISAAEFRSLLRSGRRSSATYARIKASRLLGSACRHRRFAGDAIEAMPDGIQKSAFKASLQSSLGDMEAAEATLNGVSDDTLLAADLLSVWTIFRGAGFDRGELRLSRLIAAKHPGNVFARMHVVNTMIKVGETGAASDELDALRTLPKAGSHANLFVRFYLELNQFGSASDYLACEVNNGGLSLKDRLAYGRVIAKYCQKAGEKGTLEAEISSQVDACERFDGAGQVGRDEYAQLVKTAVGVDLDLGRRAVRLALRKHPSDGHFQEIEGKLKPARAPRGSAAVAAPVIFLAHAPAMRRDYYGKEALEGLRALGEVRLHEGDAALTPAQLVATAAGARVIVADRMTEGPAAVFAALPDLAAFVRVAVDIRNVDVPAASAAGVLVTQAGPGFVVAVTELVLGFLVDLARGAPGYAAQYQAGTPPVARMGRQLAGSTLGIIGYGRIGRRLAPLGAALGMAVLVSDPHATAEPPFRQVELMQLLAEADFVVCLAVATEATENLMDAAAFARMRRDAFFVNVSRGNLVDDAALEAALREGRIAGAALDVGRAPDQMPTPALAALPNVIATPHVGGMTPPAIAHQALETVRQVEAILRGEAPPGAVNAASWTRRP